MLIVAGSILDAENILERLKKSGVGENSIRTLIRSTSSTSEECEKLKAPLNVGDIVVATIVASRGVDLAISDEVKKAGGLHIIATFPASNRRLEAQVLGRAARNGQPGSGELILLLRSVEELLGPNCMDPSNWSTEKFTEARDSVVGQRLKSYLKEQMPKEMIRAELFKKMCQLLGILRSKCERQEKNSNRVSVNSFALKQCQERWAFWIEEETMRIEESIGKHIK